MGEKAEPAGRPAEHSGRVLVRMPASLHSELVRRADAEGVSLNQFVVAALAGAVGWLRPEGGADQPE